MTVENQLATPFVIANTSPSIAMVGHIYSVQLVDFRGYCPTTHGEIRFCILFISTWLKQIIKLIRVETALGCGPSLSFL